MGVFVRPDSPFYWLYLERGKRPGIRERTTIPSAKTPAHLAKPLRLQAEAAYLRRMHELAVEDGRVSLAARSKITTVGAPPKRSPHGWCYVYILQQGEMVKIGRAVDVGDRLSSLQTGNGRELSLVAAFPAHALIEKAIHERFKHLHEKGEWFQLDDSLRAFIEAVRGGANPIALIWD